MAKKQTETLEELARVLAPAFSDRVADVRIIDEPVPGLRYRHLTVIWDHWHGVSQPDRGKVILDTFQRAHPNEPWRVLEVTLAMGLTTAEAERLNLKIA